jgi:hypothetical protein
VREWLRRAENCAVRFPSKQDYRNLSKSWNVTDTFSCVFGQKPADLKSRWVFEVQS